MYCKNCGEKSDGVKKFCINCGTAFSVQNEEKNSNKITYSSIISYFKKINTKSIVWVLIILAFIGYNIYTSRDESAIETNNNAISSFDSGNNQQAIAQLQDASQTAVSNENKINSLKNLAYVYETDGKNEEALNTFEEALKLASKNSFDHYLISAEIALLQGKPNSAYLSFNKALEIQPNDFQINNSLAIFYMNLDNSSADYENYPKALTYALKANNIDNSEGSRQNLGIAYFWNENYDQSISFLSQTNLNQHPYIGFWLGYDYLGKNDSTRAKSYFKQAINAGATPPQEVVDYLNLN